MENTRAILTIKQADELSKKERRRLANWLFDLGDFLVGDEVSKDGLSRRFTARFIES